MRTVRARMATILTTVALTISAGGCGDDDGGSGNTNDNQANQNTNQNTNTNTNGVNPQLIPGGGVMSGPIAGTLHVYVVRAEDDAPISGASVRVGEPESASPLVTTTDQAGLATFVDASLTGPQTITATASGRGAVTWLGVPGANATLPLVQVPAPTLQTATVSGTVEGWMSYSSPGFGMYRAAIVNYSHTDNILGAENSITQPVDGEGVGLNLCIFSPIVAEDDCNWSLVTRTGRQIIYATIVNGDPNGTPSDITDDTMTVIGYAALTGLDLTAGQNLSGQTLLQMNDITNVTVSFPAAPAGLEDLVAVPYIVMGVDGRVPAYIFTGSTPTAALPQLSGPFAGGVYDFIGIANTTGAVDTETSLSFLRNVNIGGGVSLPAWLPIPTGVTANAGTYSFGAVSAAQLHTITYVDAQGHGVWVVLPLDGRTSFTLPALAQDPLPSGQITMTVAAMAIPGFDPANFNTPALADTVSQTSTAQTTFTH